MRIVVVLGFCLLLSCFHPVRSQCDPLVPENCLLPFPNNFWTRSDPSTPTGLRLNFADGTAPPDNNGVRFSMHEWHVLDGWSPSTVAMAYFANVSLELSNVAGWTDIARSFETDCPTILLDAETGEILPHFAELDYAGGGEETGQQAFMVWPTKMLKFSHRYIVAMRYLRDQDNRLISPSVAFAALRDGTPSGDPAVEGRRALYEDIFSRLQNIGVRRNTLQLAWDFTTGSSETITNPLVKARDDAMRRISASGPEYTILSVTDEVSTNIYREIYGRMQVPCYHTNQCRPGCRLVMDQNGNPQFQGFVGATFVVSIPRSCADGSKAPCAIMNYGHGLLGSKGESTGGTATSVGNEAGYIIVGVDMWGMAAPDYLPIGLALLNNIPDMVTIPERSVQGILNHLLVVKLMMGAFANDPAVIFNGRSVIDTSRRYYWGISQGGILGSVVMAVTQDIEKGHLGVPGGPYPLLLARSVDFDPFFQVIKVRYLDPVDRILLLSYIGLLWDRAEPGGYMNTLSGENRLPGNSFDKRIYIDYAKGDAQVTYLGAYFMARSMGAKIFNNNVYCHNETVPIYGFAVSGSTFTEGSLMVGFDFGVGCGPIVNLPPPKETDTHGRPRNDNRNRQMAAEFFARGTVTDACGGNGCYSP